MVKTLLVVVLIVVILLTGLPIGVAMGGCHDCPLGALTAGMSLCFAVVALFALAVTLVVMRAAARQCAMTQLLYAHTLDRPPRRMA